MSTPPPLSVLMPVYNTSRYLGSAAISILQQTFGDSEIVLVDDESTDDSRVIAAELAREDPRVRVFERSRLRVARVLNEGLALHAGFDETAIKYARRLLRARPLSPVRWARMASRAMRSLSHRLLTPRAGASP